MAIQPSLRSEARSFISSNVTRIDCTEIASLPPSPGRVATLLAFGLHGDMDYVWRYWSVCRSCLSLSHWRDTTLVNTPCCCVLRTSSNNAAQALCAMCFALHLRRLQSLLIIRLMICGAFYLLYPIPSSRPFPSPYYRATLSFLSPSSSATGTAALVLDLWKATCAWFRYLVIVR